ncbi:MAG TPA: nickel-dependent lactate racemase [Spirochaetia bacterium]|nr:nickel-dependent lactate racemase [Spirochaetia bacterium]
MRVGLAYGGGRLDFDLPESAKVSVVEPEYRAPCEDPYQELREALAHPTSGPPLRERVSRGGKIGIIVNDITRATPNPVILSAIVDELGLAEDDRIVLFNATGTHRANSAAELEGMLGPEAFRRFAVVQNDARSEADHALVGRTRSGNDIRLHRELLDCDLKILTGFIEPHFFAGFSGGGKAVMPGMAALSTILHNHSAANMDHPRSSWGVTDGNPVYEEVQEAAAMIDGCFLLNVALNRDKKITAVFSGDLPQAHREGCAYVRASNMVQVASPFDVVITGNSGYPLDLNLYQSVKGMSAAAGITKEGGEIIIAAECWDGIPAHGEFGRLLRQAVSPSALLDRIRSHGFHTQDMWQAQILAKVVERHRVHFYSDNLTAEQLSSAFLTPCASIEETVETLQRERDERLSICVLPEGPVTVPFFA